MNHCLFVSAGEDPTNSMHHSTHVNQELCLGSPNSCLIYSYTQTSYICIINSSFPIYFIHVTDQYCIHNMWQTNTSQGSFSLSWDLKTEMSFVNSQNKVWAYAKLQLLIVRICSVSHLHEHRYWFIEQHINRTQKWAQTLQFHYRFILSFLLSQPLNSITFLKSLLASWWNPWAVSFLSGNWVRKDACIFVDPRCINTSSKV
jgi:hypothetical protein